MESKAEFRSFDTNDVPSSRSPSLLSYEGLKYPAFVGDDTESQEDSEERELAPCPPCPPPLGIETKLHSMNFSDNLRTTILDQEASWFSKKSICKRIHELSLSGRTGSGRSLVTSGRLTGFSKPVKSQFFPGLVNYQNECCSQVSFHRRKAATTDDEEESDNDEITTAKARSGSLASLSSRASTTLSRILPFRRRSSLVSMGNNRSDEMAKEKVSKFCPSSCSSPATPKLLANRFRNGLQYERAEYCNEGKFKTISTEERAKIVMRLRGGGHFGDEEEGNFDVCGGMSNPIPLSYATLSPQRGARSRSRPLHRSYLSAVRRLMSAGCEGDTPTKAPAKPFSPSAGRTNLPNFLFSDLCPSCRMPFDKGRKRKLVDTCGHERCYACMFKSEVCPLCSASGSSLPKFHRSGSGVQSKRFSPTLPFRLVSGVTKQQRSRTTSPPPLNARPPIPSNRHNNQQLSKDSKACYNMANPVDGQAAFFSSGIFGRDENSRPSRNASKGGLVGESSQFRGKKYVAGVGAQPGGGDPSSQHSHESGFQSSTSLTSLDNQMSRQLRHRQQQLLAEKLSGTASSTASVSSNAAASCREEMPSSPDELLNELIRNCEYNPNVHGETLRRPPDAATVVSSSSVSPARGISRYEQLDGSSGRQTAASRRSCATRSSFQQPRRHFVQQFRQPHWTLKPLFFEVPSTDPNPVFMGRAWLYREISDHLCSDLPTNRGVIVAGAAGSGKTAVVLQLVENSCFGRGEFATQELQTGQRCSSPSMSMLDRHDGMDSIYSVRSMVSSTSTFNYSSLKSLSAQVVAYHFCQSDNAPTCLVPEFVHSVAAQMSQAPQLIPYYQLIASDSFLQQRLSLAGCVADPSSALVDGILKPLGSLKRLGKLPSNVTCVVVIDGLCDAETHRPDYGDTIAGFLSKHLLKFPTWLKLVCTVRTGRQEITKLLPFQKISLDKADVDERLNKDVSDYIMHRIQKSPTVLANITPKSSCKMEVDAASRFTRYVVAAAEGCFLYARMMLDLVERGHLVIKSSSFNVLPLSLSEIFTLEFSLKFPSGRSFDKVKDILAVALASLVPMTPSEIFNSANALVASNEFGNSEQQPLQWGEFLIRFSALSELLVRRADDTVMFFHPSLREWLIRRNCDRNRKFLCDPKVGHAAIAFRMSSQETPLSPDKTLELGHHILKAHIYKNVLQVRNDEANNIPSRDLHAIWLGLSSSDVSKSLGSVRNISSPNVKVSRLLLLSGADPDHRVADCLGGAPLLCIYAHLGHADMVAALLEFGADVGACNTAESVGALTFAAAKGHLDIVQTLLHHGAPVNGVDKTDVSALVAASRSGHLDVVGHLVSNCEWQTDAVLDLGLDEAAQQAMVAASSCGHDQVLEFLLDMSEVKVDLPDTLLGRTGLCAAASNGNLKCAEILLRRRAKVSTTDLEGTPALHLAVSSGHWQATELLIKEGASLEQTDSFGRTPLMAAAREGHAGLVELLCNKGGRHLLEARDKEGNTPLIWASRSAKPAAAAALLDAGADVSYGDSGGRTPLDHAVAHVANDEDSYDTVRLLMERGAELERVDVDGRRPLDRAIECGNTRALQAFLRKGAKLGPATWAVASNKPDIMLILLNKLLEDGNTLYKRNKFQDAAHRYVYAVRRLPVTNNNVKKMTSIEEEEQLRHENLFQQLKIHLLLNLSRCQRKMGEWKKAIETATQVIEDCHLRSNPSSRLSALHARAKTFKESGQLEKAGQDLTEALKLSPHNRDLHRLILKVKEDMRKSEEEEESGGDCPKQELEEDAPLLQPVGIGTGEKFSFLDETVTQS